MNTTYYIPELEDEVEFTGELMTYTPAERRTYNYEGNGPSAEVEVKWDQSAYSTDANSIISQYRYQVQDIFEDMVCAGV